MSFKNIISKFFDTTNTLGFTLGVSIFVFIITLIDCFMAPAAFMIYLLLIEVLMLAGIISTSITYCRALANSKKAEEEESVDDIINKTIESVESELKENKTLTPAVMSLIDKLGDWYKKLDELRSGVKANEGKTAKIIVKKKRKKKETSTEE